VKGWNDVAKRLDAQGEIELAGDVRYFAAHLPPVRTDRERLAEKLLRNMASRGPKQPLSDERRRDRSDELTR
jgi:hypothetical protein